jgi:hypothetical protein
VKRKASMVVLVGLLAILLSACGGGTPKSSTDSVGEKLSAALMAVPGVANAKVRYSVNPGMGSTVHVLVTAAAGTQSLETVMKDSLKAFASGATDVSPSAGVSFQVGEQGQPDTITPDTVGLPQSPTVARIIEWAGSAG